MQSLRAKQRRLRVAIISKNPETLDGLEGYLQNAGLTTSTTRRIERFPESGGRSSAVVVFPDDFHWDAVLAALAESRRRNPRILQVIVTAHPQRFEALAWSEDDDAAPLLVPKPAWGWTILDAVLGRLS